MLSYRNPVSGTKPEDLVEDAFSLENINDVANQLQFRLLQVMLVDDKLLAVVVPLCSAILLLQGEEKDVGIVVSSEDVLVGVDECVRKRIADVVEPLTGEARASENVVKAVHSA